MADGAFTGAKGAYLGSAVVATGRDLGSLSQAVRELSQAGDNLEEALSRLAALLSPITRPAAPSGDTRGGQPIAPPSSSAVVEQVRDQAQRLRLLFARVEDLSTRVEV